MSCGASNIDWSGLDCGNLYILFFGGQTVRLYDTWSMGLALQDGFDRAYSSLFGRHACLII